MRLQSALRLGRIECEPLPCHDLMKVPIHMLTGQGTKGLVDKPSLPFSLSNRKVRNTTSGKCNTQGFFQPWFDELIQLHHRKPSITRPQERKLWRRTSKKAICVEVVWDGAADFRGWTINLTQSRVLNALRDSRMNLRVNMKVACPCQSFTSSRPSYGFQLTFSVPIRCSPDAVSQNSKPNGREVRERSMHVHI